MNRGHFLIPKEKCQKRGKNYFTQTQRMQQSQIPLFYAIHNSHCCKPFGIVLCSPCACIWPHAFVLVLVLSLASLVDYPIVLILSLLHHNQFGYLFPVVSTFLCKVLPNASCSSEHFCSLYCFWFSDSCLYLLSNLFSYVAYKCIDFDSDFQSHPFKANIEFMPLPPAFTNCTFQ